MPGCLSRRTFGGVPQGWSTRRCDIAALVTTRYRRRLAILGAACTPAATLETESVENDPFSRVSVEPAEVSR